MIIFALQQNNMLNQFHLQSLGFTLEDITFTNKPLYVFGKQDVEHCGTIYHNVPIIYYDIEKQLARASRGEFSNISRICDTIEDLGRFIECISFLFNLSDLKTNITKK